MEIEIQVICHSTPVSGSRLNTSSENRSVLRPKSTTPRDSNLSFNKTHFYYRLSSTSVTFTSCARLKQGCTRDTRGWNPKLVSRAVTPKPTSGREYLEHKNTGTNPIPSPLPLYYVFVYSCIYAIKVYQYLRHFFCFCFFSLILYRFSTSLFRRTSSPKT